MERLNDKFKGKRIYFDANYFIYGVEKENPFYEKVGVFFQAMDDGDIYAITSEFTLAEVLAKPFADKNTILIEQYTKFIQNSDILDVCPLSRELLIESAKLRAKTKMKYPDIFHLSTALHTRCDFFVTNDGDIKVGDDIERVLISDL